MHAYDNNLAHFETFGHLTLKHRAILASLVFPRTYEQSIVSMGLKLFKEFISVRDMYFTVTAPDITNVILTLLMVRAIRISRRS